ncbi:MAG TPA: hypothetical protein VMG08_06815 [Allosphingosinicella sp.]|nr:hypothetical protein [Allosphingosinicella sp.]
MRAFRSIPMLIILGLGAAAQAAPPQKPEPQPAGEPRARIWREPPGPMRDGRFGMPVVDRLHVGVGRFGVTEPARPRTHTEPIGRAADVSRRDRGIAAVGLFMRF